jgi:uncharacterized protein with PIN domain
MEVRFLTDTMLGKLAKWLRVMGYDVHYQAYYKKGEIQAYIREGRLLLSRSCSLTELFSNSFLVLSTHIKDQIQELVNASLISTDSSRWFTRCILCNVVLNQARKEEARDRVPEYVFSQNIDGIRYCPSCNRYFWPGSHREKMISLMAEWGF